MLDELLSALRMKQVSKSGPVSPRVKGVWGVQAECSAMGPVGMPTLLRTWCLLVTNVTSVPAMVGSAERLK